MKPLLIRGHLGLGDHLVCNGLYRYIARQRPIQVICKREYEKSIRFMLWNERDAIIMPVHDDEHADRLVATPGTDFLKLGVFNPPFDGDHWDQEFYRQAMVPFSRRWEEWEVERDPRREFKPPRGGHIFLHEDQGRGYVIDRSRLPDLPVIEPHRCSTEVIFDYCGLIESAEQIHCIDSCFAILADSMPTTATRLVFHHSARNGRPPLLRKNWVVV